MTQYVGAIQASDTTAMVKQLKKLNVMVKIFGRNAPVELNYVQVEKVE